MKITILTCTYKLFMRDAQIEALSRQTFKDIEWIIVDDCYEENKGIHASFPLIHIPPSEVTPYCNLATCANDGLVRASGKYVFFMNDYVIPQPECLARHWQVQERMKGCLLSGRDLAVEGIPAMVDGEKVMLKDYRMALFDSQTIPCKQLDDGLIEIGRDGVMNWWAGRNDSAPLEAILECNGFEEGWNGRWGGQDTDMAHRLMTYGLKYYLDRNSTCLEFEHPRGNKKSVRTEQEQQALEGVFIKPRIAGGAWKANTDWLVMLPRDLKGEREQWKA